jgi:hypothetical protein
VLNTPPLHRPNPGCGILRIQSERGKKMRALKKQGNYRLYLVDGMNELWFGVYGKKNSYMAGYVANPENMDYAVYVAEEEMTSLMMEV